MLLGITFISFLVIQLAPGAPIVLGGELDPNTSPEAIERLRTHYNLDKPLYQQYWLWLKDIIQLDFGTSFHPDGRPVLDKILERLPITLWMNVIGLTIVLALAIPLGVSAARRENSFFDKSTTVLVFIGFAAPGFWVALLIMIYFGVELGWVPISGIASYGAEHWPLWHQILDWGHHLLVPIFVGVMGSIAGMSRYTKSNGCHQSCGLSSACSPPRPHTAPIMASMPPMA